MRAVVVALVLGCALAGCASGPAFDRAKAVDDVVRDAGGRVTRPQAECYVDRVVAELGTGALNTGTAPQPEQVSKLTRIRIDCVGVASLGTEGSTAPLTIDPSLGTEPMHRGDDPDLDALADACAATGGAACDDLFDRAPLGSDYEAFAASCGGRSKELSCADAYPAPAPSTTASTTASTTTTTKRRAP